VAPRTALGRSLRLAIRAVAVATVAFAAIRASGWAGGPYPLSALLAFTPYALAGAVGAALVAAAAREHVALGALGLSAIVLAGAVVPRSVSASQPAAGGPSITITTANLLHGEADPKALAEIVERRGSDVVALQELNAPGVRALRRAGAFTTVPHTILGPGQVHDDVGVAARWPVRQLDLGLPTVYNAVAVEVPGYGPLTVVSAHPTPPVRPGSQVTWRRWLDALPGPNGALAGGIVAGDFNATLDHPQLRRLLDAGWRDAGRERGDALEPTWHGLPLTRLTIDHVLVPPGAAVTGYVVDDLAGSDHRAVTVTVRLPRR
jgi:endonuclease/exonuclease/phosphatase family metal-dependent hydrolase